MQISNPPLFGIIAGILVGASPLGTQLFQPNSALAMHRAAQLPTELKTCLGELLDVIACPRQRRMLSIWINATMNISEHECISSSALTEPGHQADVTSSERIFTLQAD